MKLVVKEILASKNLSVRALADLMPDGKPSYRTIDEFIRRGGGTLATALPIAKALGQTLDEIYVADDFQLEDEDDGNRRNNVAESNESLYNNVMEFAMSNDGPAAEAAKKFAEKLRDSQFDADDFNSRCVAFLTAGAVDIAALSDSLITQFIKQCAEHNVGSVITRMVDIYTDERFEIKIDKLTNIAIALDENKFSEDSVRCFARAEDLVF